MVTRVFYDTNMTVGRESVICDGGGDVGLPQILAGILLNQTMLCTASVGTLL